MGMRKLLLIAVRTKPGETRETETPFPASSRRNESEKPRRPNLVVEYRVSTGIWPATEATVIMEPRWRSNIPGNTARVKSKVPSKLTLTICAICSIDSFSYGFDQA